MNRQLNTFRIAGGAAALMLCASLAACGGGGGGDSSNTTSGSTTTTTTTSTTSTTSTSTSVPGTVSSAQYSSSSAQLAAFNFINQARQQCGFGAMSENTLLDTAATNHAQYMVDLYNSTGVVTITDTEVSTNNGYTGATYQTRAEYAGIPSDIYVSGVSGGAYTNPASTESEYGTAVAEDWLAGVYHQALYTFPTKIMGVGEVEAAYSGNPLPFATVSVGNFVSGTAGEPIAFPCNGMTNIPYEMAGESPTPPNVGSTWGPAISVTGQSLTDVIRMQSATLTPSGGSAITLQVLDSTTDTNSVLPAYRGVAYATSALSQNTTYTYTLNYTVNGVSKTATASFTTGTEAG